MADGKIEIQTEIDNSKLDKGLSDAKKGVNTFSKDGQKSMAGFSASTLKAALPVAALSAGIATVVKTIGDLPDSYKTQEKAETQLESAAKNNPYLSASSVQALKDYASELQNISTTGDEELLPFMGQLAAQGRTQEEIMKIMAVSLDVAASGSMTLESAVRNLGKTYGGYAGELGETLPAVKALTQEQLKNGAAVDVLAESYKGTAQEVAQTIGTQEQLNNSIGDFKEELGAGFEKPLSKIRLGIKGIVDMWTEARKEKRLYDEALEEIESGDATAVTYQNQIKGLENLIAKEKEYIQQQYAAGVTYATASENKIAAWEKEIELASERIALEEQHARALAKSDAEEAARLEKQKEIDDLNQKAADYIAANTAAREKQLEQMRIEAELRGESVEDAAILDVYMASYVSLVTESNGLVTESNIAATSLLSTIQDMAGAMQDVNDETGKLPETLKTIPEEIQAFQDEVNSIFGDSSSIEEQFNMQLEALRNYYKDALVMTEEFSSEREEITKLYNDAEVELNKKKNEAIQQAELENIENSLQIASDFIAQFSEIINSISELVNQQLETEAEYQKAKAEDQYANGEISAEEYAAKIEEIDKKLAQEQYKIAMWQWSANLLSAVANTALGVTQAIAQGGVLGIVTGALVSAAGAVQIAAVTANKPIPPSFATGGIVGGNEYRGDKVQAMVNSGEMILNSGQQRNLFDSINTGNFGSSTNVTVNNQASNKVSATPEITEAGVKILIQETVTQGLTKGKYGTALATAQSLQGGINYPT